MIRRLVAVGCVVAVAAGAGFAQNARVNALAGAFTIPDMSWVLSNPAYALDYKDAVQATYSGSSSPLIGVKSLGDMLVIGGTYTYRAGTAGQPDAAPHLIIGADLDAIKLGIEAFYERSIATSKTEVADATSTTITESRAVASIPGLTLGLNMDIDVAALAIVAGVRLPGSIDYSLSENSLTTTTESTTSSRDLALSVGLEAVVDVSDMDVTVGLAGVMVFSGKSNIEYSSTTVGGAPADTTYEDETGTTDRDLGAGLYVGVAKELENVGALVAAQVEAGINRSSTSPFEIDTANHNPGKEASNSLYLNWRGAIEKTWSELERLDAFVLRSGLVYGVSTTISHEDGEVPGLSHMERSKAAATRSNPLDGAVNGFNLTLGLGILKGIVSFDVELSPTAMINTFKLVNGTFAGSDFGSATLTFDFMSRD